MRAPLLGLAKSIYYAIFNSKGHLRISLKYTGYSPPSEQISLAFWYVIKNFLSLN